MEDLVSIIMPNYNCGAFLEETIQSVLSQTYSNWELLFVDDCSTDDSIEKIKKYSICDSRIRVLQNEKNMGAAFSRNRALQAASGKWIAFLDSDDLWKKEKLKKQIDFMKDNNYDFSYTNYRQIDSDSKDKGVLVTGPKKISHFKMLQFDYIGCLTVIYNQEKTGVLYVDPRLQSRNDYALWLKVSKKLKCYLLNEDLARYRLRNNSLSHHSIKKLVKNHYYMFRISENYNRFCSVFLTIRNIFWSFFKKAFYVRKSRLIESNDK